VPTIVNISGHNALHLAVQYQHTKIADIFIAKGIIMMMMRIFMMSLFVNNDHDDHDDGHDDEEDFHDEFVC